jgi:hypothetical protein
MTTYFTNNFYNGVTNFQGTQPVSAINSSFFLFLLIIDITQTKIPEEQFSLVFVTVGMSVNWNLNNDANLRNKRKWDYPNQMLT